ncbi:MAG TPA: MMPL family transporter [Myxococcales bacterium]|nr:MMPL family transporter [Myxococcales bacterium]
MVAACVKLASGLEIKSSFQELLPEDVPSVKEIKQLIQRVGGDGTVLVVVESLEGPTGLKKAEELGTVLSKDFLAMGPEQIRAVQSSMAPIRDWYENHWPLFVPLEDLGKARDAVKDEIRKRTAESNPLAVSLDDEEDAKPAALPEAADFLDPKKPLPRERVAERFAQYVDGFMVSPDHRSVTLIVRPAGTSLGVSEARALVDRMQSVVDRRKPEMDRDHLRVGLAGSFPLFIAEYEAIINDVAGTALLCTSLVLISILLFFRDVRSVITLGLAIVMGVTITFGITRLVIGYLNTQTAFLGAIVVGNGINYGLIYLARLKQLRWQGVGLRDACLESADTTSRATLLASAGTSVSFGVLIIAANRGFRHFGFIGGIGMMLCWLCTFLLVPALLVVYERVRGAPKVRADRTQQILQPLSAKMLRRPRAIIAVFFVLSAISAVLFIRQLPTVMERNLDNLTNEFRGHNQLKADHDRANSALGRSIAGAIALLDSWTHADAFCDVIRQRMKQAPYDRLIDGCDTLSSVVPRDQEEKLKVIRQIVDELPDKTIRRLDPKQRGRVRQVRDQLAAQKPVTVEQADPSLVDRFRERDGTLGSLASITAKPQAKLELAPNLAAFVQGVRGVQIDGRTWDATGENVIFADLLANIDREGPRTTLFSFAGVCLLVILFFRTVRTAGEVMGSLFIGVLLMCGVAAAIDLKINFFNFIVFPITFGIAVDYGANVVARSRLRGGEVVGSLAEVGPAVALCSWTTIIGYGSLLFSLNRALRSFGWYAIIGEFTTLVTALMLLPALLVLARPRARAEEGSALRDPAA